MIKSGHNGGTLAGIMHTGIANMLMWQRIKEERGVRVTSVHACRFFSTRDGVVGPPEGEAESGRHIISTHGEEKIWRETGFLQVWGTVHNKSSCMPG